ncbi:LOW QUALITY PROTEIN: hypothetical protein NC653_026680 [Populus alba x Populus x berolinensis]|uniref:PNPLA domain-containing protein n=1 Tax=Populus alba x Populus x berolinensis TaxID=444605 RepID=A0AAD6MFM6_9ROSI|nr:LOW QUALITY PROTEIN: hypothetical protein NC653_026680 [Populus alba x Populus x berolinensis]
MDLSSTAPFMFSRADALETDSFDFRLWEVCRQTSAEPGLFDPFLMGSIDGHNRLRIGGPSSGLDPMTRISGDGSPGFSGPVSGLGHLSRSHLRGSLMIESVDLLVELNISRYDALKIARNHFNAKFTGFACEVPSLINLKSIRGGAAELLPRFAFKAKLPPKQPRQFVSSVKNQNQTKKERYFHGPFIFNRVNKGKSPAVKFSPLATHKFMSPDCMEWFVCKNVGDRLHSKIAFKILGELNHRSEMQAEHIFKEQKGKGRREGRTQLSRKLEFMRGSLVGYLH